MSHPIYIKNISTVDQEINNLDVGTAMNTHFAGGTYDYIAQHWKPFELYNSHRIYDLVHADIFRFSRDGQGTDLYTQEESLDILENRYNFRYRSDTINGDGVTETHIIAHPYEDDIAYYVTLVDENRRIITPDTIEFGNGQISITIIPALQMGVSWTTKALF